MKKIFLHIIVILTFTNVYAQQDPQLSHYFFMKEYYNPAYAGYEDNININMLSHQQWQKFEGAPLTTVLSADAPLSLFGQSEGIGLNLMNDKYGFVNDFRANLSLAYIFNLGVNRLSIGINPGLFSKKFKPQWKFPDQQENILEQDKNAILFDFGIGAYYTFGNYYTGFSISHLFRPAFYYTTDNGTVSSPFLTNHYFLMAGYTYQFSSAPIELTPSVFIKSDGNVFQEEINIFAQYNKKIWISVSYRNKDALVFFAGTSYFKDLKIGLSYDLTLSYLNRVTRGTFEAYLGYSFSFMRIPNAQTYRNVKTL